MTTINATKAANLQKLLLCISIAIPLMFAISGADAPHQESGFVSIETFLSELSSRNGDLFTIEKWCVGTGAVESITAKVDFAVINSYTSAEKILPVYFPRMKIVRSTVSPNIYHVSDTRLADVADYSMNTKIKPFKFSGMGNQFIPKLGDHVPNLKARVLRITNNSDGLNPRVRDVSLSLDILSHDARSAMTEVVDAGKSKGWVWTAITRVIGDSHETEIGFASTTVIRGE